jgi:hypothetical protein
MYLFELSHLKHAKTSSSSDIYKQMSHADWAMCLNQRPCITRQWTPAVPCLGWLDVYWKWGGGGSCKGRTVPPAYDQSCPAVIWGVLQLWRRRITMLCTLSRAFTKLSISGPRQASRDPYFSLVWTCFHPLWFGGRQDAHPRVFTQAFPLTTQAWPTPH